MPSSLLGAKLQQRKLFNLINLPGIKLFRNVCKCLDVDSLYHYIEYKGNGLWMTLDF
jgi:hypothetical protein